MHPCTGDAQAIKKEARIFDLHSLKPLAEVHGNRTHLPPSSDGTPDLKSGGPTSEPRTSATLIDILKSTWGWRTPGFLNINPIIKKDKAKAGTGRRLAPGLGRGTAGGLGQIVSQLYNIQGDLNL
jgi:hypothetical protein